MCAKHTYVSLTNIPSHDFILMYTLLREVEHLFIDYYPKHASYVWDSQDHLQV
jgi:hypothetical protein